VSRPFIPAPNCASVELIYTTYGEICENTFSVQKGSPFTLSDLQDLRDLFITWDEDYWEGGRVSANNLIRIRTKALDTNSSPTEDYNLPTPNAGTIAGNSFPLNVSFCLRLTTGFAGRSYRGRLYIPGVSPDSTGPTPNNLLLASATGYVALLEQLKTALDAADLTWVVLSYRNDGAWRDEAVATPITGISYFDLNLDSQRRRLAGRGT
jgi:hypothetical protein